MIGWLYDLIAGSAEKKGIGELRRRLLASLEGDVVEIGAGTGLNLPHYERATRLVAVEPDASMAKRLRGRIPDAKPTVDVVTASAESLPFADETFDVAVCTFVLCSVRDPGAALAEIRRVLRPGGSLVLLEHVRGDGRLATWQDRLTPLHRRVAGNCHLNRDTLATVQAAGFDPAGVERIDLPGELKLYRAGIRGVAIKTSS